SIGLRFMTVSAEHHAIVLCSHHELGSSADILHGVDGVEHQVEKHLMQELLIAIDGHLRPRKIGFNSNVSLPHLVLDKDENLFDNSTDIVMRKTGGTWTG